MNQTTEAIKKLQAAKAQDAMGLNVLRTKWAFALLQYSSCVRNAVELYAEAELLALEDLKWRKATFESMCGK